MTLKVLWISFTKMSNLIIGQVVKSGARKPFAKHGPLGFPIMEIFDSLKKKRLSTKKSKRFFTVGYLNGLHMNMGRKENQKNEEESI